MYALLASGDIHEIQIGGSVGIPLEALRNWIDTESHTPE